MFVGVVIFKCKHLKNSLFPANISCFPRRLQDAFSTSSPKRMFAGLLGG